MEAIILAGGKGTRLKNVVSDRPKPLALINGVPFLEILLDQLDSFHVFKRVFLSIGYMQEKVLQWAENKNYSFDLVLSVEKKPLGTGGALKQTLKKVENSPVLILNGDSYLDFSFSPFLAFHKAKNADISLICLQKKEAMRFGSIIMDLGTNRILSFEEKKVDQTDSPSEKFINAGIYLFQKDVLQDLPFDDVFSLEKDAFPHLLKKRFFSYYKKGLFIDIGTEDSYQEAQNLLKSLTKGY